jgi:hypothetical protein
VLLRASDASMLEQLMAAVAARPTAADTTPRHNLFGLHTVRFGNEQLPRPLLAAALAGRFDLALTYMARVSANPTPSTVVQVRTLRKSGRAKLIDLLID